MERTFGPADAQLRQQIQAAEAETLLAWPERILTAETPKAVFHRALPPAEAQAGDASPPAPPGCANKGG